MARCPSGPRWCAVKIISEVKRSSPSKALAAIRISCACFHVRGRERPVISVLTEQRL